MAPVVTAPCSFVKCASWWSHCSVSSFPFNTADSFIQRNRFFSFLQNKHRSAFLRRYFASPPRNSVLSFKPTMSINASSSQLSHSVSEFYHMPGIALRDHWLEVPLDHAAKETGSITIFAREVVEVSSIEKELPYLLYLQGGPGFESPRPVQLSGWIKAACQNHRVILLDQRGTGLSSRISAYSLSTLGDVTSQANYLKHFRADSIVKDAELLRSVIVPHGDPWTVLGQSYGGFCSVTYLSFAPQGLRKVFLTGGLPPIMHDIADVYRDCYKVVIRKNDYFYSRFPQHEATIRSIILHIADSNNGRIPLPSGGYLTPQSFQSLGLMFGQVGGFEKLHYLIEIAWEGDLYNKGLKKLSYNFLREYENMLSFDTNPLYAIMHESIYCQGSASKWAAQRVRDGMHSIFDAVECARQNKRVLFTGEMIYPWMFQDITNLHSFTDVAELIATKDDWPDLYNITVLNSNKVPVAALIYYDDMYVSTGLSQTTAQNIHGCKLWVTNEYEHSGIRDDGERIFSRLVSMLDGSIISY